MRTSLETRRCFIGNETIEFECWRKIFFVLEYIEESKTPINRIKLNDSTPTTIS